MTAAKIMDSLKLEFKIKTIAIIGAAFATALIPAVFASAQPVALKILAVPYVSEAPGNIWTGPWKNACEEASIAMLQYYYMGRSTETVAQSKVFMQKLFLKERKLWGSDANSDAGQTLWLITDYSDFSGRIAEAPTISDIKAEIDGGRPVIVPLNGFELANPHIPFLRTGSGYHMPAIIGYDDAAQEFITNDVGDNVAGAGYRYGYDRLMVSIHDYDRGRSKADGPARAIFTYPKLAKTATNHRVYYLHEGIKQYVNHPLVFVQRGWSWAWVNVVSADFLASFKDGAVIGPR